MSRWISFISLAILLFSAACSPDARQADPSIEQTAISLWKSPIPKPNFVYITFLDPYDKAPDQTKVCASLDQGMLWETGTDANSLRRHLEANTLIEVDGYRHGNMSYMYSLVLWGDSRGTWGGLMKACVATVLKPCVHMATLKTTTISGKPYIYGWAFEVK